MDIVERLYCIGYRLSCYDIIGAGALIEIVKNYLSLMNDTQKSLYFYNCARYYELAGEYDFMCEAANNSYELAQTNEQRANALYILAIGKLKKFEKDKAPEFLTEAEKHLDHTIKISTNCDLIYITLESLRQKSGILSARGDFNNAIVTLSEAAAIAEKANQYNELPIIICQLADVYSLMGHKNIALSEFHRAEKYAKQGGNYDLFCRVVIHRLATMFELSELNPDLAAIAKHDLLNIAHQKI